MQQLTQKLIDGRMMITEVAWPSLASGCVLVRNHYSLISAGTEGSTVKAARKSLLGKAKERPQQVKQVLDVLKSQGPVQTYRAVMKKLDAYSSLGYSCVGEVIEVAADVSGYSIGDFVACGGLNANHAEVVSVPKNLCVKVNGTVDGPVYGSRDGVRGSQGEVQGSGETGGHVTSTCPPVSPGLLKQAAYNTLGAIAMQGVRQADLRLGETCGVIGLGLLGQLSCLLLRASGVKVVGLDVDSAAVERARENCADLAFVQGEAGVREAIEDFTHGLGCDAVIITAATDSLGPINFAGEIARKKGRVVVSGAVATGFDREPHYYRKELEIRMSCSYGPGRYDLEYEEKGIDYPPAYVRWTENRNMASFQELIRTGRIDLGFLTTHEFSLADAPKAYDLVVNRSEPFLGILIKYDVDKPLERARVEIAQPKPVGKVGLAFIGAGSYAQGSLLPNLPKDDLDVVRKAVMTSSGTSSKTVAEKFGFEFCTSDKQDILDNDEINTVFICTRHSTHGGYVLDALRAGKNVFVEKPLCLSLDELNEIQAVFTGSSAELRGHVTSTENTGTRNEYMSPHSPRNSQLTTENCHLMVGFNRRFAPLAGLLKEKLGSGPMAMIYRVNAGAIPGESWIQDAEIGGGRIVGEVCHFVDFMTFMCGSLPVRVYASALPDPHNLQDTVTINLEFENGSIGTVAYLANGAKSLAKEYVEVYKDGATGVLRDFKELEVYGSGRPYRKKLLSQDKGQKEMLARFIGVVKNGEAPPIRCEEIFSVSRTVFGILESIQQRASISLAG